MSNMDGPLRFRNKLCAIDSINVNMYGMHIAAVMSIDHLLAY